MSALALCAALAVGLWVAALNVRYRDFRYAIPFLVQLWFFSTPVAYSAAAIPEAFRGLLALNPMTGVVVGFRWALTGGVTEAPSAMLLVSTIATIVILIGGLAHFRGSSAPSRTRSEWAIRDLDQGSVSVTGLPMTGSGTPPDGDAVQLIRRPFRRGLAGEEFWALRDVSFDVDAARSSGSLVETERASPPC